MSKKPEPAAPAAEAKPRDVVPLTENRWQLKEFRDPGGWACVPHGTEFEDLLEPRFWSNVARHLRPQTTAHVHWDDASRYAIVYVIASGRNWASVNLLEKYELTKSDLPQAANRYDISFNGPVDKFRVTRRPDNAVIQAGFDTELTARRWLDEYLRRLAA